MHDLHRNLTSYKGHVSTVDISLLDSLPSDSEYTSASEVEPSLETPSEYLENQDNALPVDITGNVTKLDVYPFDCGNTADIYRGELASSEDSTTSMVAIKIFRRIHTNRDELQRTTQRLYKEAKIWNTLRHENILQCLGISRDVGPSPALISPLCSSGSVTKYLQKFPKTDDEKLQIVIGVARGLEYLHSQNVVHGSLSTTKILIDADEVPVICGYGTSKVLGTSEGMTSLIPSSFRFTAPEYFAANPGEVGVKTTAGDVYSFAMVILEIMSGARPFHDLPTDHMVLFHVIRGGRPSRDQLLKSTSDEIWHLLTYAWNQISSFRPVMAAVLQYLETSKISGGDQGFNFLSLSGKEKESQVNSSSGEETSFEDASFTELSGLDLRGRVCQDDQFPFACGGNSNIYRGKILRTNSKSIRVVIKVIRVSDDGTGQLEDMLRRLKREASIWSRLKHKNLLPFIGICSDIAPWPVLVSPFYKYGHLHKYLSGHPDADRMELILGVADGLEYLHSQDVVHGDLKAENVLIDKRGNPCISDFGISKVLGHRGFTTACVGTPPYMAPELFFVVDAINQQSFSPKTTKETDVYSFGLLVLEILTSAPLRERPKRPMINTNDHVNLHPRRSDYSLTEVPNEMWDAISPCWALLPSARPSLTKLKNLLKQTCYGKYVSHAEFMLSLSSGTTSIAQLLEARTELVPPSPVNRASERLTGTMLRSKRIMRSCIACRNRKTKCTMADPSGPCERCILRRIPCELPGDVVQIEEGESMTRGARSRPSFANLHLKSDSQIVRVEQSIYLPLLSNDPIQPLGPLGTGRYAYDPDQPTIKSNDGDINNSGPSNVYNKNSPLLSMEACIRCHELKVRCKREDAESPCERCAQNGNPCLPSLPTAPLHWTRSSKRKKSLMSDSSNHSRARYNMSESADERKRSYKTEVGTRHVEEYDGDVSDSGEGRRRVKRRIEGRSGTQHGNGDK